MIEDSQFDEVEVVEYSRQFFPAITLKTFPHVFKLRADTVARFLEEKVLVTKNSFNTYTHKETTSQFFDTIVLVEALFAN